MPESRLHPDDARPPQDQSVSLLDVKSLLTKAGELLTAEDGVLKVPKETRNLLALFSDGTFLVVDSRKYDGRVLSFQVLAKKKRLKIQEPVYVPISFISDIYRQYDQKANAGKKFVSEELHNQMQRDFVNLVSRAAPLKVSDIHILVADHTTVMFRVDGMLQTVVEYDHEWGESFVRTAFASADISDSSYAQNEYQSAQKMGETPLQSEGQDLYLPSNVLAIRMQFNPIAFASRYLVMRLLYANEEGSDDLRSLGYSQYELDMLYRMRSSPIGLCVCAGPTGSGKSTTLQRNMIRLLKERRYEINLITVEDPPEYPIPGARQMPVTNTDTEEQKDEAFTQALSAALRSDPDVLMVGEVRSLSAAQLTFKGSLSGHNVWTTLHANSASAVVTRLRDMGVETFKLKDPELMKGIISQRLFRRVCPHCRVPLKDKKGIAEYRRVQTALGDYGIRQSFLRGSGCPRCNHRGVLGRLAVCEIILPDAHFLDLMLKEETKQAIDYWVQEMNGRTLKDSAIEKMLTGVLDVGEVERWCGLLDERSLY